MPGIKLHLSDEEYAPVARKAAELHVSPEDIAYAGLDYIMSRIANADICSEIQQTKGWRPQSLPRWCDSARSVHAYEAKADDHAHHSI